MPKVLTQEEIFMNTFMECGAITIKLKGEVSDLTRYEVTSLIEEQQATSVIDVSNAQQVIITRAVSAKRFANSVSCVRHAKRVSAKQSRLLSVPEEAFPFRLSHWELMRVKEILFNKTGLNVYVPDGFIYWGKLSDSYTDIAKEVLYWKRLGL
jgi:hypothetical protein